MRPTLRDLLALAWPLVISRATQTIVGLADAVMVAHLGASALAATTTGATHAFLLLILPMGVVFIVQSFASQLAGKGDRVGARRYALAGLSVAVFAELLALATLPAIEPTLALFPYEPDVRDALGAYLAVRLLSAGPAVGIEALGNYYAGLGRTRLPMVVNVGLMVLNVALNALLIDGRLGAPALGVTGAAMASTLATSAAFVGVLAYFLYERHLALPRGEELLRVLRFGVPSGLNWFFEFLAFNLFVSLVVAGLGTNVLASLMAVMQINAVSFMPAFGVASAGAILIGQAIGRGDRDDVPRLLGLTFRVTATWQGLVGLVYVTAPGLLFAPFAEDAPSREALLDLGVRMLVLSAGWQIFDAAATVLSEALRAAGDTLWPLLARLCLAWGVFVPGSWLTVHTLGGGDTAAVLWLILYLALLAGLLYLRFRSGRWRTFELTEPVLT